MYQYRYFYTCEYIVLYLFIMDIMGPTVNQSVRNDKVSFGTSIKCVDYAGVLIFKFPHQRVSLYI